MKLHTKLMLCTAFVSFGTAALAVELPAGEVTRQAIEAAYAGYESIEVKYGPTQVKVEAIDAETGQKIETVYERASGVVLKSETSAYTGTVTSGSEFKSYAEDFEDSPSDGGDDNGADDSSGGNDSGGDGADDSSGGSDDNGADDSSGGSDGGSGSGSDGGNDSSGGNDSGSDSSGGDDN